MLQTEAALEEPLGFSYEDITYSRAAKSLARDYLFVYYVNFVTEDFIKFSPQAEDQSLVVSEFGEDFFEIARNQYALRVHPEDREPFLAAATRENVLRVLTVDRSFILNFRFEYEGKDTYFEVKATRVADDDDVNIVIGVTNVDAHMKRVEEYEKARSDRHTFARILEAMAVDYLSIYYINMETGEYVQYDPMKKRRGFGIDTDGENFFGKGWQEILDGIHIDDRDAMAAAFSQENLEVQLSEQPTYMAMCRLDDGDRVSFASIKATRMGDDDRHIIIGINDIDDQIRREKAHAKALDAAQAIANQDSLTGVKSMHAFTEAEAAYNQKIADGDVSEFAVVVCDVNGLKTVNDTLGHKAGDALIKKACSIICKSFRNSPVYRIGGDEFVAILTGPDYESRETLIQEINELIEENMRAGSVVIAIGSSDFGHGVDTDFLPVFERADAAMYARKAELKAAN